MGYEKSASLQEIREGRGLSNTILMMQIPHDGPAGATPWLAGGGATRCGVPEKNPIAPFVLSTDRDGKPLTYQGRRYFRRYGGRLGAVHRREDF